MKSRSGCNTPAGSLQSDSILPSNTASAPIPADPHTQSLPLCSCQVPAQPVRAPHVAVVRAELNCAVPHPGQAALPSQFHTAEVGRGLSSSSHPAPSRLSQGRLLWTASCWVLRILQEASRQCVPGSEHPPHSKKRDSLWTLTHLCAHCLLSGLGTTHRTGSEPEPVPNTELLLPVPGKGFQMEKFRVFRAITRFQGEQSLVGSPSCWAQTSLAVRCFPWTGSGAVQKLEPHPQSCVRGISRCLLTDSVPASLAREAGGGWAGLPHPSGSAGYQHHLLGIGELARPSGGQSTAPKRVCPAWHSTSPTRQLKVS